MLVQYTRDGDQSLLEFGQALFQLDSFALFKQLVAHIMFPSLRLLTVVDQIAQESLNNKRLKCPQ